jgi:hypothetical protein
MDGNNTQKKHKMCQDAIGSGAEQLFFLFFLRKEWFDSINRGQWALSQESTRRAVSCSDVPLMKSKNMTRAHK